MSDQTRYFAASPKGRQIAITGRLQSLKKLFKIVWDFLRSDMHAGSATIYFRNGIAGLEALTKIYSDGVFFG